jgi:hypothetical protein
MTTPCPRCHDTGEQRYWEGRWRDEKAENERLQKKLEREAKLKDSQLANCHAEIFKLRNQLLAYAGSAVT